MSDALNIEIGERVLLRLRELYLMTLEENITMRDLTTEHLKPAFKKFPKQAPRGNQRQKPLNSVDLKGVKDTFALLCKSKEGQEVVEGWKADFMERNVVLEAVKMSRERNKRTQTKHLAKYGVDMQAIFDDLYAQENASNYTAKHLQNLDAKISEYEDLLKLHLEKDVSKEILRLLATLYALKSDIVKELYKQNAPSEAYKTMVGLEKLGKTAEVEGIKTIEQTTEVQAEEETELTVKHI